MSWVSQVPFVQLGMHAREKTVQYQIASRETLFSILDNTVLARSHVLYTAQYSASWDNILQKLDCQQGDTILYTQDSTVLAGRHCTLHEKDRVQCQQGPMFSTRDRTMLARTRDSTVLARTFVLYKGRNNASKDPCSLHRTEQCQQGDTVLYTGQATHVLYMGQNNASKNLVLTVQCQQRPMFSTWDRTMLARTHVLYTGTAPALYQQGDTVLQL